MDCGKSVAYLETCLTMPCLGSTNSGADFKLQNCPKEDGDKYLFQGLQVHCSHVIAIHLKLKVHPDVSILAFQVANPLVSELVQAADQDWEAGPSEYPKGPMACL